MSATGDHRQILISTDGHAGADLRDYKAYLDPQHRELFDAWADGFHDAWAEDIDQDRDANNRAGVASANAPVNWDSTLRNEHLDGQGMAAEVLFPNTPPPFYPSGVLTSPAPRDRDEYELRFAGLRAHNRWLSEFCAESPERRAGFAQVFLLDVDDAVAEVRWAKEAGLQGVLLPGDHVQNMQGLYYPALEPLWAACAELQLPIHRHAAAPTESLYEGGPASQLVHFVEGQFYTGRAISHLIFAGVFERYPDLKFVTTEIASAAELQSRLATMDMMAKLRDMGTGTPFYEHTREALEGLERLPSEYFATNCYVGGPHDLRRAVDAGVPNLMWGADFPHSEGTAPFSVESLRAELADLSPDVIDELVCGRAAAVYGFDLAALQPIADEIGPTIAELTTPLADSEWPSYPDETACSVFRGHAAA